MAVSMQAVEIAVVRLLITALLGHCVGAKQPDLCADGANCRTFGNDHVLLQARSAKVDRAESQECRMVKREETCFMHVNWAMERGVRTNPEWYPGLTPQSTFDEFQAKLHEDEDYGCPQPCPCDTVSEGHECYPHVRWAQQYGIRMHPDWYPGLTNNSSFKEVQAHLHSGAFWGCPQPCDGDDEVITTTATTTVPEPRPSLSSCKSGCGRSSGQNCHFFCELDNCPGMRECCSECYERGDCRGSCEYQCNHHYFPCYP